MRKSLILLPLLSTTFATTVWFPVSSSSSQVPSLWRDGFQTGFQLGYEYCLLDKDLITKLETDLKAINLLLRNLPKGTDKGDYIEITLKIPKNNPSLVRVAKHLQRLLQPKHQLQGWLVYCNCSKFPEWKIGWFLRKAQTLGYNPLKLGKVVIFDTEPTKVDAQSVAKELGKVLGIKLETVKAE